MLLWTEAPCIAWFCLLTAAKRIREAERALVKADVTEERSHSLHTYPKRAAPHPIQLPYYCQQRPMPPLLFFAGGGIIS